MKSLENPWTLQPRLVHAIAPCFISYVTKLLQHITQGKLNEFERV